MKPDLPSPPAPGKHAGPEDIRRRAARATQLVGLVILTVLMLAGIAWWLGQRAARLQHEAEDAHRRTQVAEQDARMDQRRALLAEARSTRVGQSFHRREGALEAIRQAAAILPGAELRDEAIAALALPEQRLEGSIPLDGSIVTSKFDRALQRCALALTNGDIVLRRLSDGMETQRFRKAAGPIPDEQGDVRLMEFSPDGKLLLARYQRGGLAAWEVDTGKIRFARDIDQQRRTAAIGRFTDDSRYIVAPVAAPDGFEVMDTVSGQTVAHFPEISSFHHARPRPGTNQFAAYREREVILVNWTSRQTVARFAFPAGARVLAWSHDGRRLAIGGNQFTVDVWDVEQGTKLELSGHKDDVVDLLFEPDGERLATISLARKTRLWDLSDGHHITELPGRRLAEWGTNGRTGWSVGQKQLEVRREVANAAYTSLVGRRGQGDGRIVDVSPNGRWAVTIPGPEGLEVWDLANQRPPDLVPVTNAQSLCFHPKRPELLVARRPTLEAYPWDEQAQDGRDLIRRAGVTPLRGVPRRKIDLVTCSAEGNALAYVETASGRVWVEQLDGSSAQDPIQVEKVMHSSVAYASSSPRGSGTMSLSPDGRWLVVGADGKLGTYLFDARTGQALKELDSHWGYVQFSPDGHWLILLATPYRRLFRTADWSVAWTKPTEPGSAGRSGAAAFSPDSARVAITLPDGQAMLLAAPSGEELARLESPRASQLTSARWTADGQKLIFGTRENTLDVWNPDALGRELQSLGLGWGAQNVTVSLGAPAIGRKSMTIPNWVNTAILPVAGVVAAIAFILLRRHRRLLEEYAAAEGLAWHRARELAIEREMHELKTRFISIVSHEFRTPLGIIMSAVELLRNYQDRLPAAKRAELHTDIYGATRHMAGLMEQVLVLGRVEGSKLACKPAPIDLVALGNKLVDELLSATNGRCSISFQTEGSLQGASGDEALLRHILSNLLSNGVKYSASGSTVDFNLRREGANAVFTVRDRGIGIPEADLPRLFEAFQRAGNVGEIPGTGLGMLIVKRCVDAQQGRIEVQSKVGEGTTVTVTLPMFGAST